MVNIIIRICDLCEDNGEYKDAVAEYTDAIGEVHDICADCKKIVIQEGLLTRDLRPCEITIKDIRNE